GPATSAVRSADVAAVRPCDGAADRETEAGTGDLTLGAAALKLVEQAIRIPAGQSRAVVLDDDFEHVLVGARGDEDPRSGRRVLRRVLEKVGEELHDQGGVDAHGREVRRERQLDTVVAQALAASLERSAEQVV